MITLTREKGNRMWGGQGSSSIGGGGSSTSGFASQGWVDENYLSKSFFSTLFIIHATQTVTVTDDQGQPVGEPSVTEITLTPNLLPGTTTEADKPSQGYTTTTVIAITSIEATKNFYSDGGVSALGQSSGGGGGGATALTDLVDVNPNMSPSAGDVLTYRNGKWTSEAPQGGGGTGTVTSITAGTGLSGGTITSSGTIAINSTYQSYISHGETAYGWGDHANAGYWKSSNHPTTLSGYGITDAKIQNGTITLGSNTITPLTSVSFSDLTTHPTTLSGYGITDALSSGTTFWGSSVSNGVVNGSITMQNGTGNGIYMKDIGGSSRRVLSMDGGTPSGLYVGMDMLGYGTTFIRGNNISFAVGSSPGTDAMEITSAGRVYVKQASQGLRIGDALLTWDSTNKVLNLTNVTTGQVAHFVASGGVTALQTTS